MPRYVSLGNWTDEGAKGATDTVNRYQAAKQLVASKGGTFEHNFWTVGPYDFVSVIDVPDEETGAAIALLTAAGGNLRTLTMRAFTEDEMKAVIGKMG
jgi:uncharacterized protein with GYD domain